MYNCETNFTTNTHVNAASVRVIVFDELVADRSCLVDSGSVLALLPANCSALEDNIIESIFCRTFGHALHVRLESQYLLLQSQELLLHLLLHVRLKSQ